MSYEGGPNIMKFAKRTDMVMTIIYTVISILLIAAVYGMREHEYFSEY